MDKEVQALTDELARAERKMRLIQERKDEYILRIEIPLELINAERELQEKLDDLKAQIGLLTHRQAQPDAESQFPIFHVPFYRNPNFTGREDALATMRQHLPPGNSTVLVQAVAGLGGVGKTQSAVEFAYRHEADYDLVWWIRTESDELFTADYTTLVSRLNLPVKAAVDKNILINVVHGWLADTRQRWLLIFDNAETLDQLAEVLPTKGNGHVIITSRNPNWRQLGGVLPLTEFSLPEASDFLRKRTGDSNQAAAEQVAELLGNLPLALEQAAAYMAQKGMPLSSYATLYREQRQALWQRATPPRHYPATLLTTWELAFQQIQQTNPTAAQLLNLCAFLAPDNISLAMIRSGLACLPEPLATALGNPLDTEEMLAALYRYSLIHRKEDTITLHRLVQEVTQDRLEVADRKRWLEVAINLINLAFPFEQYAISTWSNSGNALPHLTAVASYAEKEQIALALVATLWQKAALYLREQGEYTKAQTAAEHARNLRTTLFGENHLGTAESLDLLGQLQHQQANYQQAQLHYERTLIIRQRDLGQDHADTAMSLNNLGVLFQDQGEYGQAHSYLEQALAIRRQVLGDNHPDTATSLSNLGTLFEAQGEYGQARRYYEQDLAIRRQVLGDNHPDTAISLNNLGLLFEAQGEYGQARRYYEQALAIQRQVLGANHPHTATSLNNLGVLFQKQGEYGQARRYYEQALAIQRQVLGDSHPHTAMSLSNLGVVLRSQGEYEQARRYLEQALTIRRQVLGNNHPDTATSLNNLGMLLVDGGRYVDARSYLEEALPIYDKMYPQGHPNLITLLNNLGSVMIQLKQVLAARRYLTRAADLCKNTHEQYPECEKLQQTLRSLPGGLLKQPADKKRTTKKKR